MTARAGKTWHRCQWISALVMAGLLFSCRPLEPTPPPAPASLTAESPEPDVVEGPLRQPPADEPRNPVATDTAISPPRFVAWTVNGISFEGVAFDARSHRLVVVDQPNGPGSRFATAAQAANSVGGIAAVNAGFFGPAGEPIGLVVSRGHPTGQWNNASAIGSGVWHQTPDGTARIIRRENLGPTAARRMTELLQSGPMLVDGGQAVPGLHGGDPRPRTLIAWDGRHRWWTGCTNPCTMPNLATALASTSGTGFSVRMALNLDGGRSSELWVGGEVAGGPLTRRPPWNRTVRNHLVLLPR